MYKPVTQLNHFLEHSVEYYSSKVAFISGKHTFTYHKLNELANNFAQYLTAQGISRGDRVVVSTGNSWESVVAFWGTLKIGGIISLISDTTSEDKLLFILADSGASVLVCTSSQYNIIHVSLTSNICGLKNILMSNESECEPLPMVELLDNILKNSSEVKVISKALDIDLASIMYTSGSTGEPKGVMLTHRNMITATNSINQYLGHKAEDVIVSALPLSFDYGLYQMIMAFSMGAMFILEPNFIWPAALLKKIALYKGSVLPVVPSMVPLLEQHGTRFQYNLSSVRCVTNTGAALNLKHIGMLQIQFPAAQIFSMYGLTECKRCTYLPPDMIDKKPGSIGIAIPNTELWIIDENGQKLGPNQLGQLVIRGATVMKGYWNNPSQTDEKLKDGFLPSEKLLYTGDYCWLDEDGYLYFHGRMDDILKCRGIKVSPKEIEEILIQHPDIFEAAIIGVENMENDITIHAFVATTKSVSKEALLLYCQNSLSAVQRPKELRILKSLPKSSNGKIDKHKLKSILQTDSFTYDEAL